MQVLTLGPPLATVIVTRISSELKMKSHGILWVFEQLIEKGIIDYKQASIKLKALMETNPRLPIEECEKNLSLWRRDKLHKEK